MIEAPRRAKRVDRIDPRGELLALHLRLFRRQKRLIELKVAPESAEMRQYRRSYERAVRRFDRVVPYAEVVRRAGEARLVVVGDYHTLPRAQKSYRRLCERLIEGGHHLVLALELVPGRFQRALDAFLAGRLDESGFLSAIHYRREQPFDIWPSFRTIFDLARAHGLPVIALDSQTFSAGSLASRDAYAARRLETVLRKHPGTLGVALMGQLHLSPEHLPRALRLAGYTQPLLTVYQNCEEIYWDLAAQGREQTTEAVRLDARTYSLIHTSPLVAQQSYLDYVEAAESGERVEWSAPERHFHQAGRLLAQFLDIDPPQPFSSVEVATPGDLSLLSRLRARGLSRREVQTLTRQILARESYCLPHYGAVYLASSSVNQAAEVAARYLWHLCADEEGDVRGLVDGFYANALEYALGFFGSKVLNPRRTCPTRRKLLRLAEGDGPDQAMARAVLAHQRFERGERAPEVQRSYVLRDAELFHAITRTLGQILGDRLYAALLAGRVSKSEIRSLFFDAFEEEGAALHTYLYLSGKLPRRG